MRGVLIACSGLTVSSPFAGLSFELGRFVWLDAGLEEQVELVSLFSKFSVSPFEMSPTMSSSSDLQLAVSFPLLALC